MHGRLLLAARTLHRDVQPETRPFSSGPRRFTSLRFASFRNRRVREPGRAAKLYEPIPNNNLSPPPFFSRTKTKPLSGHVIKSAIVLSLNRSVLPDHDRYYEIKIDVNM